MQTNHINDDLSNNNAAITHHCSNQNNNIELINPNIANFKLEHILNKTLISNSGRADKSAIAVLKYIIDWYKPHSKTGKKRFTANLLQINANEVAQNLFYSDKTVRRALTRLEQNNYLSRKYHQIGYGKKTCYNVMFVELNTAKINDLISTFTNERINNNHQINDYYNKMSRPSGQNVYTYTFTQTNNKANSYVLDLKNLDFENLEVKKNFQHKKSESSHQNFQKQTDNVTKISGWSYKKQNIVEFLPLKEQISQVINEKLQQEFPHQYYEEILKRFINDDPKQIISEHLLVARLSGWASREKKDSTQLQQEYGVIDITQYKQQKTIQKLITEFQEMAASDNITRFKRSIASIEADCDLKYQLLTQLQIQKINHSSVKFADFNDKTITASGVDAKGEGAKTLQIICQSYHNLQDYDLEAWQELLERAAKCEFGDNIYVKLSNGKKSRNNQKIKDSGEEDITVNFSSDPIWSQVEQLALQQYGSNIVKHWFNKMRLISVIDSNESAGYGIGDQWLLKAENKFLADYFRMDYLNFANKALRHLGYAEIYDVIH